MEDAEAKLYKIIKEMNMYGSHGKYISPEEEAKNIKKCSILQDVPIEYSYFSESSPKFRLNNNLKLFDLVVVKHNSLNIL